MLNINHVLKYFMYLLQCTLQYEITMETKAKVQTIISEQRQQHITTEAESREWQHLSKDNNT